MSPDHPQRRPKRTRKIVGKPTATPCHDVDLGPHRPTLLYDSRLSHIRLWLADRLTALARWVGP